MYLDSNNNPITNTLCKYVMSSFYFFFAGSISPQHNGHCDEVEYHCHQGLNVTVMGTWLSQNLTTTTQL